MRLRSLSTSRKHTVIWLAAATLATIAGAPAVRGNDPLYGSPQFSVPPRPQLFLPEQRHIVVRPPGHYPCYGVPESPAPQTIRGTADKPHKVHLSLDNAIRIAIENSEVVRVLAGVTAVSSGQTIYDVAISNTLIDEEMARFDPSFEWQNAFNRFEPPFEVLDPLAPNLARIAGTRTDDFDMSVDVVKKTLTGGTLSFGVDVNPARFRHGVFPLNPRTSHSLDIGFTQPLYRGGGVTTSRVPIVVARIDTERSFYQYKNSIQGLLRSVIEAYWALVFARTDRWASEQQVRQTEFAYEQASARFRAGDVSRGIVAQARVSLGGFKAALTEAENSVLQREAALRNLLGLPPADGERIVPVTPPSTDFVEFDWYKLLALAEQNRPDLIELKLVIEADEQRLLLARNEAHPSIDATMLYRWNALSGRTPSGVEISSGGSQFANWTLGVNVSVPLTLRKERAAVRRHELALARDRANLWQGTHAMTHIIATNLRDLAQFFYQYEEFNAIRTDAMLNLQERSARWKAGGVGGISYVDLLLAITDWGNTIRSEARTLAQYNTGLANLELEAGTILEAHGVEFIDERFAATGPFGRIICPLYYPLSMRPTPNADRYLAGDRPSEGLFVLDDPLKVRQEAQELPQP
jgi:outer membrane protein TolC